MKRSLTKVEGVIKAEVSYRRGEAVVTFDDAKTDVEALIKASAAAGYPARLKKGEK